MSETSITVVGAGIVGLWQALTLARAGHRVRVIEASATPFVRSSSRWAGAMIAPECEAEGAPEVVRDLGRQGLALWQKNYDGVVSNGTLVVAPPRDAADLQRFARMTERHEPVDATALAELEPALGGRFDKGLFFAGEAHVDAIEALNWLVGETKNAGAEFKFGTDAQLRTHHISSLSPWGEGRGEGAVYSPAPMTVPSSGLRPTSPQGEKDKTDKPHDSIRHDLALIIDCRGMGARADLTSLRGVRGERVLIEARDVSLTRPVRLLHPRQPIYVVPQGNNRYVIGASVIEREDDGPMTLKSALDLLGSAYALHPAFSEAAILDMGAGVRPAFPDNVPRISIEDGGRTIRVNGVYRHGFLLAPVLAELVAAFLSDGRRDSTLFDRPD